MQAMRRCPSGTRASRSALKPISMHQQAGCTWPVSRSISSAQRLDSAAQRTARRIGALYRVHPATSNGGSFFGTATLSSVT